MTQILQIPLDSLHWHSLLSDQPRWASDTPELLALAADIAERGIDQPLIVCETQEGYSTGSDYYLLDGRHRFMAAKLAGLQTVPCVIREEADAREIILHSLIERRHFTKGQRAYLAWPMIAPSVEENKKARKYQTSKSKVHSVHFGTLTLEEWAKKLGVSLRLLNQASDLFSIFEDDPEYREIVEDKILGSDPDGGAPMGLGAAIAGSAGRQATKNAPRPATTYLMLDATGRLGGVLPKALTSLRSGFERWSEIEDPKAKARLKAEWRELLAVLPPEFAR